MTTTERPTLPSPHTSTAPTALGIMTTVLLLSGCSVSVGTETGHRTAAQPTITSSTAISPVSAVPKSDLEQITGQQIREQSGGGPVVVSCPGDLPIRLGAAAQCTLAQDGKHFHLTITITKATSPDNATWDYQVGEQIPESP